MKRKIIVFFCVFMLCGIHVRANEDPYYEIYEQSGAAELENALPDDAIRVTIKRLDETTREITIDRGEAL